MKTIFFSFILLCSTIIAIAQPANMQKAPNSNLAKPKTPDDCKKGIVLFDKNYENFKTKKASNTHFTLNNPTNNETFSFLSDDMLSDLIKSE